MFKTSKIAMFMVVLIFSLALVGCGGNTEKAKEPAQSSQQTPKVAIRGVTDDTIKIGDVIDISGPTGVMGVSRKAAMELWVKKVNEAGGINGRKIEYILEDGQYEPAREKSSYTKLLTKDEVFTVISNWSSGTVMALMSQVEKDQNIFMPQPAITGALVPAKKWVFHTSPPYASYYNAMFDYAVKLSAGKKIGVLSAGNPFGNDGLKVMETRAKEKGVQLVKEVVNFTDIDATSQVTNLKNADVGAVLLVENTQATAVIFKAADQLNFSKPLVMCANATEPALIELAGNTKAIKNAIGIQATATFMEDVPGIKEIKDLAAKYGIDKNLYQTQWFVLPWTEALLFEDALKRAGDDLSPENVRNQIESTKDFDTKGLMDKISFSPDKHYGSDAIKFVKVNLEAKQFEPASDWIHPEK